MDHPVIVFSYRVVKYCNFTTCETLQTTLQLQTTRVRVAARCAAVRASRQLPLAKLPAEILLKLIGTLVARPTHAAEAAPRRDGRTQMPVKDLPALKSLHGSVCHLYYTLPSYTPQCDLQQPRSLGSWIRRLGIKSHSAGSPGQQSGLRLTYQTGNWAAQCNCPLRHATQQRRVTAVKVKTVTICAHVASCSAAEPGLVLARLAALRFALTNATTLAGATLSRTRRHQLQHQAKQDVQQAAGARRLLIVTTLSRALP